MKQRMSRSNAENVWQEDTNLVSYFIERQGLISDLLQAGVTAKMYAKRSMGYVNMFTALGVYKLALDGTFLDAYTWYLLPFVGLMVVLVGYFEDYMGFWRFEKKLSSDRDPRKDEIINRLERIEQRQKQRGEDRL